MLCPICSKYLARQNKELFVCPGGHGTLVTGKYLSDIETTPEVNDYKYNVAVNSKHQITCPHCTAEMHKVDYNNADIVIDSCTNCQYRWLDSGEITKIKNFKTIIQAKNLLFIADIDEQMRQAHRGEIKEANPRLPLQGTYRGGAEVVSLIRGGPRVRLAGITGQGLYGIIKGLTHSKTSRILTIVTLLIFGLLFLLIFWDYRDIIRSLYQ
jgi:Zn-finger nucleic acid-binding protein